MSVSRKLRWWLAVAAITGAGRIVHAEVRDAQSQSAALAEAAADFEVLAPSEREAFFQRYFERMNAPKPLTRFHDQEEWLAYREVLRQRVLRSLGLSPLPSRVPLDTRLSEAIVQDGVEVRYVRYQVLPQVYASGWLYVPQQPANEDAGQKPSARKLPAVLNPHGHWAGGARDPVVQTRCLALAKLGYVAFCPESTHVIDLPIGLCPIGQMTWNNIRAVDFLESLPFVNAARIGCTGASGGGQQAFYLAALDDRVRAIVPAVIVSYFRRILFVDEQAHCFCNHAPGIARVTDETELAAMAAPRPQRFITASGDWTRDFPQDEFPEIRHLYRLLAGDTDCVSFDKPHNYDRDSREAMYSWMNRYLKDAPRLEPVTEPAVSPIDTNRLQALTNSSVPGLEGAASWYRRQFSYVPPNPKNAETLSRYRAFLGRELPGLLGESGSVSSPLAESRGSFSIRGLTVEKWLVGTEPGVRVPLWLFAPEGKLERLPAVVVTHEEGKRFFAGEGTSWVKMLLDRRWMVVAVDPRLRGELRRNWQWNAVIWGRPEAGMAAHDVNQVQAWFRTRAEVDPERLSLVGFGRNGLHVLFAAALNAGWRAVAWDHAGATYTGGRTTEIVPNALRYFDLPQLAALRAPAKMWINRADEPWGFAREVFEQTGAPGRFRQTQLSAGDFLADLPRWLND